MRVGRTIILYLKAIEHLGLSAVAERLRRLAIDLNQTFGCEVCGTGWPEMFPFMVQDDLWFEVTGDEDAHLCLRCFEAKMIDKVGRSLLPEDFARVPINQAILDGLRIAKGSR